MAYNYSILIEEDENLLQSWIEMVLEEHGFKTCKAIASGEELVSYMQENNPDLILMDVHLT